jgi:hypothetical protein
MSRIVEMHVERPAVGALEGLTDAARQVDIGSRNDHPASVCSMVAMRLSGCSAFSAVSS